MTLFIPKKENNMLTIINFKKFILEKDSMIEPITLVITFQGFQYTAIRSRSEKFILDDLSMYSTLEKTIFMKGVDLFKDISGQEVSNIAQIAKEREFSANERIMNHGDNGDSMFIIISGSVKVHIDNKELTTLSKGDCIGEMALLDQEPRSASVTTKEETTLLEIYGEDFYDLMASRMDIMQGIVKVLSRRIRKNNQ